MPAVPSFLATARRQRQEEAIERVETAALRMPVAPQPNPFTAAHDQLAGQWDAMVHELETAKADAARSHAENVHLREQVRSLSAELAGERDRLTLEIEHHRDRADRAVTELADTRSRFAIIRDALQLVLDRERQILGAPTLDDPPAPPSERQLSGPPRPSSPPNHRPVGNDEGDAEVRSILDRLPVNHYR